MADAWDRYHRQMLLPGLGRPGQEKLCASKVLLVGCGALGSMIADTLGRAGVGHLVIADRDLVELTNLQRQVLFDENDVAQGFPKAQAAKRRLAQINSQVQVTAKVVDVSPANIEALADGCQVILDGTDNFETRYLLNDVAVKHRMPYVYGGVVGTVGMCYTILPHSPQGDTPWEKIGRATPDLRDLFEQAPLPGTTPTCDTAGVLAPGVGVIASMQAAEAIKILLGHFEAVNPNLVHIDLWNNQIRQLDVSSVYDASEGICSKQRRFEYLQGQHGAGATVLCGRQAVQITPALGTDLKLSDVAGRLQSHGQVQVSPFMVRVRLVDENQPYELTVFADGRAIVRGTEELGVARSLYARYVGM